MELEPGDPTVLAQIEQVRLLPGEKHYAYSYSRKQATLYLINGLR